MNEPVRLHKIEEKNDSYATLIEEWCLRHSPIVLFLIMVLLFLLFLLVIFLLVGVSGT